MDVHTQKLSIIQQLLLVEDEMLLKIIQGLLDNGLQGGNQTDQDFWDILTDEQKAKIELSRKQHEVGQSISHEEMMRALRKRYNR